MEIYESEAYKKYQEYIRYMNKHPIKWIADIKGSKPPHNFNNVLNLQKEVEKILNEKQPLTIKDLDINGYDLMEIGIPPGSRMGEILNNLLDYVLEHPKENKKNELLIKAKTLKKVKSEYKLWTEGGIG